MPPFTQFIVSYFQKIFNSFTFFSTTFNFFGKYTKSESNKMVKNPNNAVYCDCYIDNVDF